MINDSDFGPGWWLINEGARRAANPGRTRAQRVVHCYGGRHWSHNTVRHALCGARGLIAAQAADVKGSRLSPCPKCDARAKQSPAVRMAGYHKELAGARWYAAHQAPAPKVGARSRKRRPAKKRGRK